MTLIDDQDERARPRSDDAPQGPPSLDGAAQPSGDAAAPADDARTVPARPVAPRARALTLRNLGSTDALHQAGGFVAAIGIMAAAALLPWIGVVAALVAIALPLAAPPELRRVVHGLGPVGKDTLARVVLAASLVLVHPDTATLLVAATLTVAVLLEPMLAKVSVAAIPYASNLPGVRVPNAARFDPRRVWTVNTVLAVAIVLLALLGVPAAPLLAAAAIAPLITALVLAETVRRVRARRRAETALPAAVAAFGPRFALHWDAPPGTEYQVTMWLPYLERLHEPFIVIVRNPRTFAAVAAATSAPVLVRRDPRDLDAVVAPSMHAVFYVNNAARNTHLVRFTGLTHVQLNHGESDKAPSYSPVFRLYDRDFVAGQAAIDRFAAHGVRVPDGLFTIVGRPQIERIAVGAGSGTRPTALYAPTWGGANADSDYCSLPIGHALVQALLARGYDVVFRPHPYTSRDAAHAREAKRIDALLAADARATGRAHRFGAAATQRLSLVDCFNAADVLVSDVSSVLPDFLQSEKPFAVAAMQGGTAEFARAFPLARAAYLLDGAGTNIDAVLDAMTGADPLAAARREAKRYFLGDLPGEHCADVFLREAGKVVSGV